MVLDIIAAILILYGFYTGYQRGLIKTVFATLSIILAVLVSMKLSPVVMDVLQDLLKLNEGINFILGFVLTFFLVMLLIRFIGARLEGLLRAVKINFINKIAGGALMAIVFSVCLGFLFHLADNLRLLPEGEKETSISYPIIDTLPSKSIVLFKAVKPIFSDFWNKTVDTIDTVKENADNAKAVNNEG